MLEPGLPRRQTESAGSFSSRNTPYDALGGEAAVSALARSFYDAMDREPAFARIRALHKPSLDEARQKLFEFLCGWLGGPELYVNKYGHPRLRARHMPFTIGDVERDEWLACMRAAMDDRGVTGEIRAFLEQRFAHVADFMRNQ